jgi:hypothetical protein
MLSSVEKIDYNVVLVFYLLRCPLLVIAYHSLPHTHTMGKISRRISSCTPALASITSVEAGIAEGLGAGSSLGGMWLFGTAAAGFVYAFGFVS